VIGLLAALVIILSQSFSFEMGATRSKAKVTAETSSKKPDTSSEHRILNVSISATSFPTSAQINFFQEATCLFEILFIESSLMDNSEPVSIPLNKFFSTILQVIISPNAP
jgi:hypothetical protein